MTEKEIISAFGQIDSKVLEFHSLYDAFHSFDNEENSIAFQSTTAKSLLKDVYRQYGLYFNKDCSTHYTVNKHISTYISVV